MVPAIFLESFSGHSALQPFLQEVDSWDDLDITKLPEAFIRHEDLRKQVGKQSTEKTGKLTRRRMQDELGEGNTIDTNKSRRLHKKQYKSVIV